MPYRPGRTLPTQSGYGHGLDLGALLLDIFGGVEANPNYNKSQPAPNAKFIGPMPAAEGSQDFYKARSIFDRARAAEANAMMKAQELEANQDVARKLQEERDTTPILASREQAIGDIKNNQAVDVNRRLGIAQILQALGQEATPKNEQVYNEMNTPILQETAAQKLKANLATAKEGRTQAEVGANVAESSAPALYNTGIANNRANVQKAEFGAEHARQSAGTELAIRDAMAQHIAGQALQGQILHGTPGSRFLTLDPRMSALRDIGGVPDTIEEAMMGAKDPALYQRYLQNRNRNSPITTPQSTVATPFGTSPQGQPVGVGPMSNSQGIKVLPDGSLMLNGTIFKKAQQ